MSGRNPDKLEGSNDNEKLRDLFTRSYKEQAIWILNGFWDSHHLEKEAENFWNWVNKHQELDTVKGKEGASLDEFNAHRFLESIKETLTVLAMREKLNKMGIEKVKNVPLAHFLIWKYNLKPNEVAKASQGSNREELEEAQRLLAQVLSAFREVESTAKEAKRRADEAKRTEAEAIRLENLAREAERPFKEAQEELNAALAELKRQEDSYKNKTEDLKRKSEEGGAVSRNKAKAELEIHLKEDPLPLRKAKITTEAAERKADKLRAPFKAARESAEAARAEAETARHQAEASQREAEAALDEAKRRLEEAERFLEEVKNKPGQPSGALWWIERELHESKKYLPGRKANK